jgi:general secretion pathway protein G
VRWLRLGRFRPVLMALVVIAFFVMVGVHERRASGVRLTRARLMDARRAVDAFMADHDGGCPATIADTAPYRGGKDAPRDAWGRQLRLVCPGKREGSSYELMSDGPDGDPGGLDRIE